MDFVLVPKGRSWLGGANAKPGDKPFCSLKAGAEVRFCGTIEHTPFGNELLEDFAEKAIEQEQLGSHGRNIAEIQPLALGPWPLSL